ncbi:MAG: hypothetical protein HY744_17910 [Deltaproteobacteria bacterium]|nr:hypothetical protein [Deltaproteobacteria bacterium]
MRSLFQRIVLTAFAAGALSACNASDGPASPRSEPAQSPQGPAARPALPAEDMAAPFVLSLRGPEKPPDKGELAIEARLSAPRAMKAPVTIEIVLPKGVKLTEGKEREELAALPEGVTARSFKMELVEGLAAPVKVVVDMRDPGGAFGAHAEQLYPKPEAKLPQPYGKGVPPPPEGRPGAGPSPKRAP